MKMRLRKVIATIWSTVVLFGIYPDELEMYFRTKTCPWRLIAALFIIAQTWKQSRCPSVGGWINKAWYILTWLPRWLSCKESTCQCSRHRRYDFDPWVGKIPWRRKWQPTPVFLPGTFHGQKSLVGYSPWGHKESDTTDHMYTYTQTHIQTMDYYSVLNRSELSGHEKIWRKLKSTLLRSLPEKIPWDMNPTTWHSGKGKTMETVKRPMVSRAGRREAWRIRAQRFWGQWKHSVWYSTGACVIKQWLKVYHQEWNLM